MSNSQRTESVGLLPADTVGSVTDQLLRPLKGAAFWAAIALPFLHVPLLFTGVTSGSTLAAFVALVVLNVVALVVGHPYGQD